MSKKYYPLCPFGVAGNLPFAMGQAIDPQTKHIWAEDIYRGWFDTGEVWTEKNQLAFDKHSKEQLP